MTAVPGIFVMEGSAGFKTGSGAVCSETTIPPRCRSKENCFRSKGALFKAISRKPNREIFRPTRR